MVDCAPSIVKRVFTTLMLNRGMSAVIGDSKVLSVAQTGDWPVECHARLDFVTPQLGRVHEIWQAKRGGRAMPARAGMTLKDLKSVLGNLAFLSIVHEAGRQRFKVRLMGGTLDDYVAPMTGQFIDEALPPHFADKWTALWRPAIDERTPLRSVNRVEYRAQRWYLAETIYAPLADDGETPDVLMIVCYYHLCEETGAPPTAIAVRLKSELDRAEMARA